MRRLPLLISMAILLALLAAVIWYVVLQGPTPTPSSAGSPAPTLAPTALSKLEGETLTDASNLYSITLPAGWKVTANEGKRGIRLSYISAESPDFFVRSDESVDGPFVPQYYERGAAFGLHAGPGDPNEVMNRPGIASRPIIIDSIPGSFRAQNDPSTMVGQQVDAMIHNEGVTYRFTFVYNPDAYLQDREVFQQILDSFHLL